MEGIFTLPYSEYDVINRMSKFLKKAEGYSFFIPVSRQQKGIDFAIIKDNNHKCIKVQIKGSRAYLNEGASTLLFKNFVEKYKKGNADLYILYGLYPHLKEGKKVTEKQKAWDSIILCFNENEMYDFLKQVRTKTTNKADTFFCVTFKDPEEVFTARGFRPVQNISNHLLKNYLTKIVEMSK
jgi:hypothetical protein